MIDFQIFDYDTIKSSRVPLLPNCVHVWKIPILTAPPTIDLFQKLSSVEQSRAEAFIFERDRTRYIVSHAALREILSLYSNQSPSDIKFHFGKYGKPELDNELQFNLSDSHQLTLCSLSLSNPVGIDIEYVKPRDRIGQLVESLFSNSEILKYHETPELEKLVFFYKIWIKKEAYLKAHGIGLNGATQSIEHRFRVSEKVYNYALEGEYCWGMEFSPAENYVAALAALPT